MQENALFIFRGNIRYEMGLPGTWRQVSYGDVTSDSCLKCSISFVYMVTVAHPLARRHTYSIDCSCQGPARQSWSFQTSNRIRTQRSGFSRLNCNPHPSFLRYPLSGFNFCVTMRARQWGWFHDGFKRGNSTHAMTMTQKESSSCMMAPALKRLFNDK